jgi:hypothetical protein
LQIEDGVLAPFAGNLKKITKFDPKKSITGQLIATPKSIDDLLSFYSHGGEFRISGT